MAINPSTGQIILAAAQGLTQTLQVQAQLVARQREREETQALEVAKLKAQNDVHNLQHQRDLLDVQLKQADLAKKQREESPEALAAAETRESAELKRIEAETQRASAQARLLESGGGSRGSRELTERNASTRHLSNKISSKTPFTYTDAEGKNVTETLDKYSDRISVLLGSAASPAALDSQIQVLSKRLDDLSILPDPKNEPVRKAVIADLNVVRRDRALLSEIGRARGESMIELSKEEILQTAGSPEERAVMSRFLDLRDPVSTISVSLGLPADLVHRELEFLPELLRGKVTRAHLNNRPFVESLGQVLKVTGPPGETEQQRADRLIQILNDAIE